MRILLILFLINIVYADVYVNGYTRSDGTTVSGYYRSSPNHTTSDNFTTYGNINPYTGEAGTRIYDDYYNEQSSLINSYGYNSEDINVHKKEIHGVFDASIGTIDIDKKNISSWTEEHSVLAWSFIIFLFIGTIWFMYLESINSTWTLFVILLLIILAALFCYLLETNPELLTFIGYIILSMEGIFLFYFINILKENNYKDLY